MLFLRVLPIISLAQYSTGLNRLTLAQINHGIALTPDGKKLFVSSLTTVWSWDYDGTTGTVSNKKEIIRNMRNGGFHPTRTLLVPKNNPEVLLVQRGSQDNVDTAAAQESTSRSMIKIFNIADIQASAKDYSTGTTLAWGLRNTVGVGEHPNGGIVRLIFTVSSDFLASHN